MASPYTLPADYWSKLQITRQDVDSLQAYLFELETPMTTHDLASVFVTQRLKAEQDARTRQREAAGRMYLPKDRYDVGDELVFPALDWRRGRVSARRAAVNPQLEGFDVVTVEMDGGPQMMFAAGLAQHALNDEPVTTPEQEEANVDAIIDEYGDAIERKLEAAFG
ncbi:MAG: hypothetical protein ACM3MF_05765, partial [Anaerolineae bacterium]